MIIANVCVRKAHLSERGYWEVIPLTIRNVGCKKIRV
jgi:hypothetical protein